MARGPVSSAKSVGRGSFAALVTAAAYFLTAEFGTRIAFPSAPVSVLWAPNAILLAALALAKPKRWWLYLAAVAVAHFASQWPVRPPGQVITQYVANCGVAIFGAMALRTAGETPLSFDRLRTTMNLLVYGALLGPLLTSMAMAAVFVSLDLTDRFWLTTVVRTATNAFAVLTFVPAIALAVQARRTRRLRPDRRRVIEALVLGAAIAIVGALVFVYVSDTSPSLLYAPVPLLLLATVRFGIAGVSGSMLLLAAVVGWGFLEHGGPFVHQEPVESALSVVFFLLLNTVSLLLLAGVLGERKAAIAASSESELQRRRSDELYKAILATGDRCVAVLDEKGCILEVNETWRQKEGLGAGIPGNCRPGASYYDCLDAWPCRVESEQMSVATRAVLAGEGAKRRIEYAVNTPEGTGWMEQTIERLHRPEGGAAIMIVDVTARKSAELEAQARYQELTHLTRVGAIGGISGAIAHELNQPLGAIRGNAEAGLRLLAHEKTSTQDLREILSDIVENSARASDVVERVRQWLRPGFTPAREPLNLSILAADVLRLVHHEIVRRKVQLRTDLPASLGLIEGDAVQIQQVILNLVMNACEAMEQTPLAERRILVTTRLSRRSREVELTVRDFGRGVPVADCHRVFMPFVTSKPAGLGLGLFISRRIVETHRGRLWCEPADPGTFFHMALPLRD
jgi:signal transduction histidine kinase/integral membrane sensor domain MASE1